MRETFGPIRQVGHVVPDIQTAIRFWTESLRIGPFFVIPELTFQGYRYRGESAHAPVVTLAISHSGGVQIELIQQINRAPSAYLEFLSAGRVGVHHYSSWFGDRSEYDKARSRAIETGFALVHESAPEGGFPRFSYFETGNPVAPLFELAEALLPGYAELMRHFENECRLWTGEAPVRPYMWPA